MIRLKHNGEIFFFNSDNSWALSHEALVSVPLISGGNDTKGVDQAMHYPKPKQVTWEELAAHYSDPPA